MDVLFKSAKIIDPNGPHHNSVQDVLVRNGKIEKIGKKLKWDGEIFESANLHLSLGWLDLRANFCDPGFEYKEDICTGLQAARKGGFTGVCLVPSTQPALSTKAQIEYIKNRSRGSIIDVFPYGSISADRKGEQIAELFDMKQAGAIAFTDGKRAVQNATLMSTALLYAKNFDALVISFPHEKSMCEHGQMHEGAISTSLGLKGLPELAEELMISRDLYLAEYNNCRIHFSGISTAKSVALIKEARKKGLEVTCEVFAHNLAITDKELTDFDQNKKVIPPFRDESHRKALIKGLKDGTINAICSDHTPEDIENKNVEFEHAAFGIINLESAYGVLNKSLAESMEVDQIITKISQEPRKILGLPAPFIEVGSEANFTLFNPDMEWVFSASDIKSKSKNTPFIGAKLKGKALAIFNHGHLEIC
jgi:dihydroorotase